MQQKQFTITSDTGIHSRPATQLVHKAGQFSSHLTLEYKEKSVNLKSIMGVMSMGIGKGDEIIIKADGGDEKEAMAAIEQLIKEGLGE